MPRSHRVRPSPLHPPSPQRPAPHSLLPSRTRSERCGATCLVCLHAHPPAHRERGTRRRSRDLARAAHALPRLARHDRAPRGRARAVAHIEDKVRRLLCAAGRHPQRAPEATALSCQGRDKRREARSTRCRGLDGGPPTHSEPASPSGAAATVGVAAGRYALGV